MYSNDLLLREVLALSILKRLGTHNSTLHGDSQKVRRSLKSKEYGKYSCAGGLNLEICAENGHRFVSCVADKKQIDCNKVSNWEKWHNHDSHQKCASRAMLLTTGNCGSKNSIFTYWQVEKVLNKIT